MKAAASRECSRCGYKLADIEWASFNFSMPCPKCGGQWQRIEGLSTNDMRKAKDALERMILAAIDAATKAHGHACRNYVLSGIRGTIADHYTTLTELMGKGEISNEERRRIGHSAAICQMLSVAIIDLAMDGNTQWSDGEIFVGQLKHRISTLLSSSDYRRIDLPDEKADG